MKAVLIKKYGPIDHVEFGEVEKPLPNDDEVLIRVRGTSVNFNTLIFVKGEPYLGRALSGLFRPNIKILGNDVAGQVEAVGKNVTQFKPGDAVFGDTVECGFGTFSEYVAVPEKALTLKPVNISFEEAAAVPEAGLVALQALRDSGQIQSGQQVLICGASGGIGTFAVQLAKHFGAEVTGVCSTRNIELVRSIGADHIIDYTHEDFAKNGRQYDLILATAGNRPIFDYKRALKPRGRYIATGGSMKQIFQAMLLGPLISKTGGKQLSSKTVIPNKDLDFLKNLIEAGHLKPIIDRRYNLSEAVEAMRYYDKGGARGKVVISVKTTQTPPK